MVQVIRNDQELPAGGGAGRGLLPVRRLARPAALLLAGLLLSACKGGSGDILIGAGGSGTLSSYFVQSFAPYEQAVDSLLASVQYQRQNTQGWYFNTTGGATNAPTYNSFPLSSSRAVYAHAVGLTGRGQTVAMADTRLLAGHEAFAGKRIDMASNLPAGTQPGDPVFDDHGTMVASIIAGQSQDFIGVAPKANLIFGTFDTLGTLTDVTNLASAGGAVALNNSWGYDNQPVGAASFNNVFGGSDGQAYLAALERYAARGVVVFSLSNDTTNTTATIMDALPTLRSGLEPGWLAVGNAVPDYDRQRVRSVQMISAGCLEAAAWCLLADGAWHAASAAGPNQYAFGTGSSFAAPQVSGALALLGEAFPNLTPHQLRLRLIASADNSFFHPTRRLQITPGFSHGYSQTYGHGFLNIRDALLPIGATQMAMPGGQAQTTSQPIIQSGAAFGDAVARSLTGVTLPVSDQLSGTFLMPGEALVATVTPAPLSRTLLSRSLGDNLEQLRLGTAGSAAQPFAAYSGYKLAALDPTGAFTASVLMAPPASSDKSFGIDLKRVIGTGDSRINLGLKLVQDDGTVMGFGGTGNGAAGTQMASLELGLSQDIGRGAFVSVAGEVGVASLGSQAVLSDISTAIFNSVHLEIGQRDLFSGDDKLSVGLSMPVAVASGSARITLPTYAPTGRSAGFQDVGLDLAPTDRQIDLALTYQTRLAEGSELMLQLVHADNYGNRSGYEDVAGLVAWRFDF